MALTKDICGVRLLISDTALHTGCSHDIRSCNAFTMCPVLLLKTLSWINQRRQLTSMAGHLSGVKPSQSKGLFLTPKLYYPGGEAGASPFLPRLLALDPHHSLSHTCMKNVVYECMHRFLFAFLRPFNSRRTHLLICPASAA